MSIAYWPVLAVLLELCFKIAMIIVVLMRRRAASATLAWIVVILVLPFVGAFLYLLVGEVRLGRRRIARHREIVKRIHDAMTFPEVPSAVLHPPIQPEYRHLAVLAESVGRNDALNGNDLRLLGETDLFIQSLVEDIDVAEHHCHLLFYIFLADHSGTRVGEAMMRAAQRGVVCRLLVDAVGSQDFAVSQLRSQMERAGVKVVEALPVNAFRVLLARIDLRNHRKLAIIDGVIGYTGSQNIADAEFAPKPRYAPWVDAMVRIKGPATRDLQELFVEDWYMDTDESLADVLEIHPLVSHDGVAAQVMGTGPNSYNEALRQLNHAAFHAAREELIVTTPYFVPDDATLTAFSTSARRGVETILIVPERNDSPLVAAASRGHYDELLESGVKLYEYHRGLLHAKTMTIDRSLAFVSTANLDRRSFELNFEVSLVVYDSDFASQLRFLQKGYLEHCRMVDLAAWRNRPWRAKLIQNAAGTLGPLL